MTDVVLRWAAATDADSVTDYAIYSDKATSGTFVELVVRDATDRGDGAYTPFATTLVGNITASATTVTLVDATNFASGDYVRIDNEFIKLGTKDVATFTACLRGQASTIRQAHSTGATVSRIHESYTDTGVTFGARHCIRYKIVRRQGAEQSLAHLTLAILPSDPPDASLCTVYGILQTIQGEANATVSVALAIGGPNNLDPSTGEVYAVPNPSTETDADGYFEFFIPKSGYRAGTDIFTLTVGNLEWEIASVPDVPHSNFLEL